MNSNSNESGRADHEPVRRGHKSRKSVDLLGPADRGRWLVTTVTSQHIWDLDAGTYQRLPGGGQPRFLHDEVVVPIARVERWPAVGATSLVWFDEPAAPLFWEHWRRSSTVVSIELIDGDEPAEDARGDDGTEL